MKKSIVYCHLHNIDQVGVGIRNKIYAQIDSFKKMGLETHLLTVKTGRVCFDDQEIRISKNPILARIIAPLYAIKLINNNKYDYLFIRGFGIDPSLLYFLKRVRSIFGKIIFEFPTFPYDKELQNNGFVKKIYLLIDRLCRENLKKYIDLCTNYGEFDEIWGIPSVCVQNCIDISQIEYTGFDKKEYEINFIGVAGLTTAHGYDRMILGIANYYTKNEIKYNIKFHIVGKSSNPQVMQDLQRLTNQLKVEEYIKFYGELYGEDLTKIFKLSNFGVGALGMHRKGLLNGSILKVREYFGRGIPFVISYDDIAIRDLSPYYYSILPNEVPVDIDCLIEWYEDIKFDGMVLRQTAEKLFVWSNQFNKIFNRLM